MKKALVTYIDVKPEVGDLVKISNPGCAFSSYVEFFIRNNINLKLMVKYRYLSCLEDEMTKYQNEYKIVGIGKHTTNDNTLCLIEPLKDTSSSPLACAPIYLIDEKGLEFITHLKLDALL